jgi:hypothetical protein
MIFFKIFSEEKRYQIKFENIQRKGLVGIMKEGFYLGWISADKYG